MTTHDPDDGVLRMLSRLPAAAPDVARAERTRQRCHVAARRQERSAQRRREFRRVLEPVIVGGFSAIYLAVVAMDFLRWHGILR